MPEFRIPFVPREEKFFGLFENSADNIVKASKVLKELVDRWDCIEQRVEEIRELEHVGDSITHEIIARLHR